MSTSFMFPQQQSGVDPLLRFSIINGDAMGSITYNREAWTLKEGGRTTNGDYEYKIYTNELNELAISIVPMGVQDA